MYELQNSRSEVPRIFKTHLYLVCLFCKTKKCNLLVCSFLLSDTQHNFLKKRTINIFTLVNGEMEVLRPWLLGGFPSPPEKDIVLLLPCSAEGPPLLPLAAKYHFCCHPW